jgi:hypothetical protein
VASKLYIIAVRWVETPLTMENVQKIDALLTPLGDWVRFSGTTWLLATDQNSLTNSITIYASLGTFLKEGDSELIIRIDPSEYSGWAAKWVDDWIMSKR